MIPGSERAGSLEPAGTPRPEHVLVADDDAASLLLIRSLLKRQGYRVTTATDGAAAVALFESERPDFVLLDVTMPVMDGYEAAARIKSSAGDRFIPIIFLTALQDEAALARCIDAGGDDFLTKPYSRTILQAKMQALTRLRELQSTVRDQRDQLAAYRERSLEEQELAGEIFSRVLQRWPAELDNVRCLLRPSSLLNGDVALIAHGPDGRLNLMLGDFTGHGLSAAVGTVPAAELFYEMSARGYALSDMATALDRRLSALLPVQFFCAAALLTLDPERGRVSIWNGGLPDVLLLDAEGVVRQRCESRGLPLGIAAGALTPEVTLLELRQGDRIYLCSDGLIDLPEGSARLGQEGFERLLATEADPFAAIAARVEALAQRGEQPDDVALLEVRCTGRSRAAAGRAGAFDRMQAARWQLVLEMGPDVLRQADPLPGLLGMVEGLQGLGEHRVRIYAVLGELYNNALEHGVLGLDSSVKLDAEGFGRYYEARARRLRELAAGHIRIELSHEPCLSGGRLAITVEDSGPGFDYRDAVRCGGARDAPCGRGLQLVAEFCASVEFRDPGNRVEAVYTWSEPA